MKSGGLACLVMGRAERGMPGNHSMGSKEWGGRTGEVSTGNRVSTSQLTRHLSFSPINPTAVRFPAVRDDRTHRLAPPRRSVSMFRASDEDLAKTEREIRLVWMRERAACWWQVSVALVCRVVTCLFHLATQVEGTRRC